MSLDNINEGVIIINSSQCVIMANITSRMLLGVIEDQTSRWKIADLLKKNEDLLELYYNVLNNKESKRLMNTKLAVNNESILINFKCLWITTPEGSKYSYKIGIGSDDILILLQPVNSMHE